MFISVYNIEALQFLKKGENRIIHNLYYMRLLK